MYNLDFGTKTKVNGFNFRFVFENVTSKLLLANALEGMKLNGRL